jgi:hypothetical protein
LCYNCDEPFVRGHQCKRLFYLESGNYTDDDDTPSDHEATEDDMGALLDASANALVVSLHAAVGLQTENSMVIYVTIKGERLLALLDTSSTHNFIQGATLRRLGLPLSGGDQLRVTVANGDRLPCAGIAQGVEVSIACAPYTITCVGIDLGCFDFILGVDFLRTLGPITWDFDARTLAFQREGRPVVWHAALGPGAPWPTAAVAATAVEQPMLDRLLQHHTAISEEPQGLPPARPYDHRIHLLPGTAPVAVRPYHYP